jgi:hypothetical protein
MPIILATQEAEIRRIMVQSQPWANSLQTPSQKKKKKPSQKRAAGSGSRCKSCVQTPVLPKKQNKKRIHSILL